MDKQEPVLRSLAMIEENIDGKLTVEALAGSIHFSKYHYQRLFREAVGESVMRYVQRRRLMLAAQELAGTGESILSIALRYGYDSHEGFLRAFKAQMGVTPTEYRKYHCHIPLLKMRKEKCAMRYGKMADAIIRELNVQIVQAEQTAEDTLKFLQIHEEAAAFYAPFWSALAGQVREMAQRLGGTLQRVEALTQQPDGISARFMLIKAIEDTAFLLSVTALHAGLTMARAQPEHRGAFLPLCRQYDRLAQNARLGAEKAAGLFRELSALIFQDMREGVRRHLEAAAQAGRAAACALSAAALPYGYIAGELQLLADELEKTPLEGLTLSLLEDACFRLEIIALAARTDALRAPAHQPLFDGIAVFRERIEEAAAFLQGLPEEAMREGAAQRPARTAGKQAADLAFQGNILLFYLHGEVQKLGALLDSEGRAALDAACGELDRMVQLCGRESLSGQGIGEALQGAYRRLAAQAERLGEKGGAIAFIAKQVAGMAAQYA